MSKISYYHDVRYVAADGTSQIKLRVSHRNKVALVPMGMGVEKGQWDAENQMVVAHPRARSLNQALIEKMEVLEPALKELAFSGRLAKLSIEELTEFLRGGADTRFLDGLGKPRFMERFTAYAQTRRAEKTRQSYKQTESRLRAFCPNIDAYSFSDIDKSFLRRFDAFLAKTNNVNSRNVHYRNIRTVFNEAIDDEITKAYPFRKFKIKSAPTRKRSLTVEELRQLRDAECEPHLAKFRDIFMLMFYLVGVNAVDLFKAGRRAIRNGRLEYVRSKTGKQYSIKVEPEAMEIIERYRGREHLLDICDGGRNYENYLHRMTKGLKQIGVTTRRGRGGRKCFEPLFPDISQYWCRHTWATLAAELDVPKETIAAGLGHDMGNTTTAIYINFNTRKVDEANRRVIDFVSEA